MTKEEFGAWIRALRDKEEITDGELNEVTDDLGYVEILIRLVDLSELARFVAAGGPLWAGGKVNLPPKLTEL